MANMSYCRFENTARDLQDCVEAINNGETNELSTYEVEGLLTILDLAADIVNNQEYIQRIIDKQ
jgi:hypothetical protein